MSDLPPTPDAGTLTAQLDALERTFMREPAQARAALLHLLSSARQSGAVHEEIRALCMLGGCAAVQGDAPQAEQLTQEALTLLRPLNLPVLEAQVLNGLGLTAQRQGHHDQARAHYLRGLHLATQVDHPPTRFRSLSSLALLHREAGQPEEALALQRQALALARDHANPAEVASTLLTLITIHASLDEHETVLELAAQFRAALSPHFGPGESRVRQSTSRALRALGRPEDSLRESQDALQNAALHGEEDAAELQLEVAASLRATGRLPEAITAAGEARRRSETLGLPALQSAAHLLLAGLHEARAEYALALQHSWAHFRLEREINSQDMAHSSRSLQAQGHLDMLEQRAQHERLRNAELARVNRDLQRVQGALMYRATHDPLTGVADRLHFRQLVQQDLDTLGSGTCAVMVFLDLDHFKTVNDVYGHTVGDALLQEVAARLRAALRASDLIGRMGGDEFTVYLRQVRDAEEAWQMTLNLLGQVQQPFTVDGQVIELTVSAGYALAPRDGTDVDTLQKNADIAMYRVKRAGRAGLLPFQADMSEEYREQQELIRELRGAVTRGELRLHFQGRYACRSGPPARRVTGFEALLRWQHPQRGLVPPAQFIPLAEDTRLIVPIGTWVLQEACRQARRWQFAPRGLSMAVNVSPLQFEREDFVDTVCAALGAAGLPGSALVLELTESLVLRDEQLARRHMLALRTLGVQMALDDFGTGYSSLSVLRTLPFDHLKIDRSFVGALGESSSDARAALVLDAIIRLSHTLNLTVTAEGVETATQAEQLEQLGCDELQGFHLSRPQPAQQAETLLPLAAFPD